MNSVSSIQDKNMTTAFVMIFLILPLLAFAQPYSPLSLDGTWTTASSIGFTPRYGLSSCALDGKIYVTGGEGTNGFLNTLEVFDPATNTWNTPVTTGTFAPHYAHTSSVVNGKIYVFGGAQASIINDYDSTVAVYDPSTNTWSALYETIGTYTPRFDLTSCVLNGKIYVIGGELDPYYLTNIVEVFDPSSLSWAILTTNSPDTLIPVLTPTSHVINGKIYVIGNPYNNIDTTNIIQVYDPSTNKWTTPQVTGVPILRSFFTSSEINGKIYVMGGKNWFHTNSIDTNAVEIFDPSTNAWSVPVTTGTFTARDYLTSSVVDSKIYAMGGGGVAGSLGYDNKNEVLTLSASGIASINIIPDLKIFPNPTDGMINMQNLPTEIEGVIVVNVLGETVMELKNLHSQDFTLDLSKLTPGTYYIRFISAKSVTTKMIVRE